ncbi:ATP-dependent RNA helicase SrmB [Stanieria sp. NIES-3757]|nr:ATP-dependent RNA helicase SrmB [Stanieria sp. NIES-3757]
MAFYAHTPPQDSEDFHLLKKHLSKVANKAKELAAKFNASELAYYAGLWHDLGKYNPEFQKYLEQCDQASKSNSSEPKNRVPHAIYGAKLAAEKFQPIAPLIYGHHGGLPQMQHMKDRLAEIKIETYQQILNNARSESLNLEITPEINQELINLVKDNLGFELLLRILFSCLVDADYLDTETHFDPESAAIRKTNKNREDLKIDRFWQTLEKSQKKLLASAENTKVNQVRSQVYQACVDAAQLEPGIFRLAVPTGGGKTRSGLSFALAHAEKYHLDRVIVAVPYTSIIEQTVEVYRAIFGQDAVLEHHSAVKPDEGNESDARSRQAMARLATQNWDAPLIVTTTVQLFESLFANRTSRCRKLHNIVNSVIILDEVQTLPVFLLEPILSVLKELCNRYHVSVVLCTATQPAFEGNSPYLKGFPFGSVRDIIPKELAKQHFSTLSRVTYQIPDPAWSWQDLVKDLERREASQALIVLNTRKDALAVLDAIDSTEEDSLFHLSTLLCGQHRREILQQIRDRLKNKQPCILVSTQVVEAGVDLDFPLLYRAIAPLDRIVQAAGRCNREGKLDKGEAIVFQPEDGKVPPGEYRKAVDETIHLLKRKSLDWHDPNIFAEYFQSLYQGLETDGKEIQKYRTSLDYPKVAEEFKLIPDDTNPVAIAYDDRAKEVIQRIKKRGLKCGDLKALQPYLVSLRSREFKQTEELREQIAAGIWLWNGNYDSIKGIAIGDQAIVYDPADLIF